MASSRRTAQGDHAIGVNKPAGVTPIRVGRWVVLNVELEVLVSIVRMMEKNHHFDLQLYMITFGITKRLHYHNTAEELDADRVVCREAIQLYPTTHQLHTPMLINSAAIICSWLFALEGRVETTDLRESIEAINQVLLLSTKLLTPTNQLSMNIILGRSHNLLFDRLGDTNDLETAIKYFEHVLELCHASNKIDRAVGHYDLALALKSRPQNTTYLDPIIHNLQQCHNLLPPNHPTRLRVSIVLCECLGIGLEGTARLMETDYVIELLNVLLAYFPVGDPQSFLLYLQYGRISLLAYVESFSRSHLDAACEYLKQALALTSSEYPGRHADVLVHLTSVYQNRFEISRQKEDMEQSVAYARQAVELCPPDYLARSACLTALASSLLDRYRNSKSLDDLMESVSYGREAVGCHAPESANLSPFITLSRCLRKCSKKQAGSLHYMDEAIDYLRKAVVLARTKNQSELSTALRELARTLRSRYHYMGDTADLDDTIAYYREAARMIAPSNAARSNALCEVSSSLCYRCSVLEDKGDLQEAFEYTLEALRNTNRRHPGYPGVLNSLVIQYQIAIYQRLNTDTVWMDRTIYLARAALQACPESDELRNTSLSNLAQSLEMRGVAKGSTRDLDEAIKYAEQVADHDTGIGLYGLGSAILERGVLLKHKPDIDEAIVKLRKADRTLSRYHSMQGRIAGQLARAYEMRGYPDDVEAEFAYWAKAANHPSMVSSERLSMAKAWARLARKRNHSSSITAYSTSLSLLERYVMNSHTIEAQRQRLVTKFQTLPLNATSCAISAGDLEVAVELLEQGRAVLWSQVGRYRTPLEHLNAANPQLATEFRSISTQLEQKSVSIAVTTTDRDASEYRLLLKRWNDLLETIRKEDGFSDFLRATSFSALRNAAIGGPVVVINIDEYRSDAIIIHHTSPPTLISLPCATPRELNSLAGDRFAALRLEGDSAAERTKNAIITRVLRRLWDVVVEPIVEELQVQYPEGSRVWWCPTSMLWSLPLHAAGPYKEGVKNLPDIFVSSYTPTLSALIRSANQTTIEPNKFPPEILLVGQGQAPGQVALPAVTEEVYQVEECVPSFKLLNGEHATRDAVLEGLQKSSWIHLACHGSQDLVRPFQSHFILYDKPLPLLNIIQTGLPNAEFAFLSACHSAAGDMKIPNEAIHLAAGLQFSGFGSVVATMWAMADADGPFVAKEFYKYMFRNPGVADYRDAAVGLNLATKALRRMKVPICRWINFIHIGA